MFRLPFRTAGFLFLFYSSKLWAAACCGGGLAAPALLLGDDKAEMTLGFDRAEVLDDVYDDGLWKSRASSETALTYRLDAAHSLSDRWQTGASVPVVTRSRGGLSSTGFGDVAADLGYEYLTDWDYHPYQPKALAYFQLTIPTAKSVQESDAPYELDSRGRGFWALGVGTVLTKVMGRWDILSTWEGHKSFARSFSNAQTSGTLHPGFGTTFAIGVGLNGEVWRIGTALSWSYEDAIPVTGDGAAPSSLQRYATGTLNVSYLPNANWTVTVLYSDQTLFGSPSNTTLTRTVSLQVQKRWPR